MSRSACEVCGETYDYCGQCGTCHKCTGEDIDRLKAELEVVRYDNNNLRSQISVEAQVKHKKYEEWIDTLPAETAMPVASWHILRTAWMKSFLPAIERAEKLESQLAEAMAEVERLKEEIHHYEDQGLWMPDKEDLVRKRAAREIIQYIVDQGIIDAGTIARPMPVYEIAECDIAELKMRFGLEG